MDPNTVTGIILAGGTSSRMGFDKGVTNFRGKPLIQYSIETLQPICSRIIISANSSPYHTLGFPVQSDIIPDSGPIGGIYSSLLHSSTDHNLVLSCDTPFVTSALMQMIMDRSPGYQVTIPASRPGFPEPLIGYYHKNNSTAMMSFIQNGNLKLIDYIETTIYQVIPVYDDPDQFINMNTPGDFYIPGETESVI